MEIHKGKPGTHPWKGMQAATVPYCLRAKGAWRVLQPATPKQARQA